MPKATTSVTFQPDTLAEAREYGLNISAAAQSGLEAAVKAERGRRWKEENAEAFDEMNRWIEKNGIPLSEYRKF